MVQRLGGEAIFGRVIYPREARRMTLAGAIMDAYESRKASPDWSKWVTEHERQARLLESCVEAVENAK